MKKFLGLLVALFFVAIWAATGQAIEEVPAESTGVDWVVIIGVAVGVIEIVARAIPNPKWTGLIGLLINVLKDVSEWLNNKGKV